MTFKTCPKCGANLDAGERCDCDKEVMRCETCRFCVALGEGDHICNKNRVPVMVIEEHVPSENYLCCRRDEEK